MQWHCSAPMPDDRASLFASQWRELARLLPAPGASALWKVGFDDFQVSEELGFACSGSGEHVCAKIEKIDLTTTEAAARLGAATGLGQVDIGYAGMKDRRARTSQWFSLRLPREAESRLHEAEDAQLRILALERNERKIRIGSHRANHFVVRLREFCGDRGELETRLRRLEGQGVPNYFGPQRFGKSFANVAQVEQLAGEAGEDPARLSRTARARLYSAARAWLFNQALAARLAEGNWNCFLGGDVLSLDGSGRLFVPRQGSWDERLQQRLEQLDIHITGPLPGAAARKARHAVQGDAADFEQAALARHSRTISWLSGQGVESSRRPLRFAPRGLRWEWSEACAGELTLHFTLCRGSYATSLLRELCLIENLEAGAGGPERRREGQGAHGI